MHRLQSILDVLPKCVVEVTEPERIMIWNSRKRIYSSEKPAGDFDLISGRPDGPSNLIHLRFLTLGIFNPLVVDMPGDTEIAGELDLGNIPNSGVQVLGRSVSIDIGEVV